VSKDEYAPKIYVNSDRQRKIPMQSPQCSIQAIAQEDGDRVPQRDLFPNVFLSVDGVSDELSPHQHTLPGEVWSECVRFY